MSRPTITLQDVFNAVQALGGRVGSLETKFDDTFQTLNGKVDNLVQGQNQLQLTVDNLVTGHLYLGNDIKQLRAFTETGFDTMGDRFDRLEDQVDRIEATVGLA
jgi:hypothetical protein